MKHQAKECQSTRTCRQCGEKRHTSICVKKPERDQLLVTTGKCAVIYPVVVVLVDGIKCRALLDTGSGSSYTATLIENLSKKPVRTEHKQIEMMVCSTTQKINSCEATISSVNEIFTMTTVLSKVDKGVLLTILNPRYEELLEKYLHLNEVVMNDNDKKSTLPIHVILGASDFSKIKTATKPKIGQPLEPIAECTTLGWTMMSSGCETNLAQTYLTRTSGADYQELWNLDVLGLEDRPDGDQHVV